MKLRNLWEKIQGGKLCKRMKRTQYLSDLEWYSNPYYKSHAVHLLQIHLRSQYQSMIVWIFFFFPQHLRALSRWLELERSCLSLKASLKEIIGCLYYEHVDLLWRMSISSQWIKHLRTLQLYPLKGWTGYISHITYWQYGITSLGITGNGKIFRNLIKVVSQIHSS